MLSLNEIHGHVFINFGLNCITLNWTKGISENQWKWDVYHSEKYLNVVLNENF